VKGTPQLFSGSAAGKPQLLSGSPAPGTPQLLYSGPLFDQMPGNFDETPGTFDEAELP